MRPKKEKPFATLMAWAGRDRWYIYAAVTMALLSSLCSIVPYFAFYRVVDAVAEGTCTAGFALEWAGIILAAAAVQTLTALFSSLSSHRGRTTPCSRCGARSRSIWRRCLWARSTSGAPGRSKWS